MNQTRAAAIGFGSSWLGYAIALTLPALIALTAISVRIILRRCGFCDNSCDKSTTRCRVYKFCTVCRMQANRLRGAESPESAETESAESEKEADVQGQQREQKACRKEQAGRNERHKDQQRDRANKGRGIPVPPHNWARSCRPAAKPRKTPAAQNHLARQRFQHHNQPRKLRQ